MLPERRCRVERDGRAEGVSDERERLPNLRDDAADELRLLREPLRPLPGPWRRVAVAEQVERGDAEAIRECCRQRAPLPPAASGAVNENDERSVACDRVSDTTGTEISVGDDRGTADRDEEPARQRDLHRHPRRRLLREELGE